MDSSEEDSSLYLDYFMESRLNEYYTPFHNSDKLFLNQKVIFGFLSQHDSSFFNVEEIPETKIKMKNTKFFEISFRTKDTHDKITFSYNLIENYPSLIHIDNSILNNNHSIILSFQKPPHIMRNKKEIPSLFLSNNFNSFNNILNLDCPYRNIFIENVNEDDNVVLRSKIFFSSKTELSINSINFLPYSDYVNLIKDINTMVISFPSFYDRYILLANISETLMRRKLENVISIYSNFSSDFKLKKYNTTQRSCNAFFILKHVQVTPSTVKIKKENFHQSSRFLRLYYHDDNFLKIEFKDDNDNQLYTNTSTTSTLSTLYKLVFQNGITICNKHYEFFLNPTNAMRSNSVWMIESTEASAKKEFYYRELGLYNLVTSSSLSFSKLLSRLSQNFTSTLAYSEHFDSEIVNDVVIDGNVFNDGCGMLSVELMKEICHKLNKDVYASAIQIRYKGAKGVLVVSPDIHDRKIMLTKSMVKFNCNNTNDLEIIRFSRYSPGYLNLQIIILLILNGIKKKTIFKYAKKEVASYRVKKGITTNKTVSMQFEKVIKDIEKQDTMLLNTKDYMTTIARSAYIYNRLSNISKRYRFHLKNCAFLIGVFDFSGTLNENEVFVQITKPSGKKTVITGDVIITKNPCLSGYDIQKVKAVSHPYFVDYFENVIVFPSKGLFPLPSMITGSDLDGDVYWVCWERALLNIEKRNYKLKPQVLKNGEKAKDTAVILDNGRKMSKVFINVKTSVYKAPSNTSFEEKCLDFHCYFHTNYKLPEVNKNYLSLVSSLMKRNRYMNMEFNELLTIEKLAFYHSIEVDFQKTGETSDFKNDLYQPTFLKKKELRKKMNFLVKLREIYEFYKYNNGNENMRCSSFYDYMNKSIESNSDKNMNHSFLRLYEKKALDNDMYNRSFIYKIYELVSYTSSMKSSFITSLTLMSDEFYYLSNISSMKFSFSFTDSDIIYNFLYDIRSIIDYYESEVKYMMMENEIINEVEMMYLSDFIEPKIPVFKNDIEDYKINLNEQIKFIKSTSFERINETIKKHKAIRKDVESALFILTYCVPYEKVNINEREMDLSGVLDRKYRIKNAMTFIEEIVKENSVDNMKYFLFDRIKCVTLYNFYINSNI